MASANWQEVRMPGTFRITEASSLEVQVGCYFKAWFTSPTLIQSKACCGCGASARLLPLSGGQQLGSGS